MKFNKKENNITKPFLMLFLGFIPVISLIVFSTKSNAERADLSGGLKALNIFVEANNANPNRRNALYGIAEVKVSFDYELSRCIEKLGTTTKDNQTQVNLPYDDCFNRDKALVELLDPNDKYRNSRIYIGELDSIDFQLFSQLSRDKKLTYQHVFTKTTEGKQDSRIDRFMYLKISKPDFLNLFLNASRYDTKTKSYAPVFSKARYATLTVCEYNADTDTSKLITYKVKLFSTVTHPYG